MKDTDALMLSAYDLACAYPDLPIGDIVGDVHQISRCVAKQEIGDPVAEGLVLHGACRFLAAEKELTPLEAVEKAWRLWKALHNA